jgi:hypothetical protein
MSLVIMTNSWVGGQTTGRCLEEVEVSGSLDVIEVSGSLDL